MSVKLEATIEDLLKVEEKAEIVNGDLSLPSPVIAMYLKLQDEKDLTLYFLVVYTLYNMR